MSRFCTSCGTAVEDTTRFCPQCGAAIGAPAGQTPPIYGQPYNQPPYYVTVRQPRPGRGFGITSMVLGIIGIVYSFFLFMGGIVMAAAVDHSAAAAPFAVMSLFYSAFGILSLIFGGVSRNRGYRCGISLSGVVLGGISVAFCFFTVVVALAA